MLLCVFRSHEPSLTQNVTASPITTIAPHQVSSKSVKGCVSLIIGEMSYKLCELSNFEADCSLRGSINQQYAIIEQQFSNCQTTSIQNYYAQRRENVQHHRKVLLSSFHLNRHSTDTKLTTSFRSIINNSTDNFQPNKPNAFLF